jgi:hypothetical protein
VTPSHVRSFVEGLGRFVAPLAAVAGRMDGTADVLRVIRHRLDQPRPA